MNVVMIWVNLQCLFHNVYNDSTSYVTNES